MKSAGFSNYYPFGAKLSKYTLILLLVINIVGCGKDKTPAVEVPIDEEEEPIIPPPVKDTPPINAAKLIKEKTALIKEIITDVTDTLAPGIHHTHITYTTPGNSAMSIHVVIADLQKKTLTAQVLSPFNEKKYALQVISQMAKDNEEYPNKILAAVNGDYFSWTGETTGPFIHDGYVAKANTSTTRPCFGITKTGDPVFLNAPAGETSSIDNSKVSLLHLVSGNQWLVFKNAAVNITDSTVEPRTAIGMTKDKKAIMIVVDGRQAAFSNGISFVNLGAMFKALDAEYAFNLDGGGSTTLVIKDKSEAKWNVANKPSGPPVGTERAVANGIAFVLK